jgi:hypothetical protein
VARKVVDVLKFVALDDPLEHALGALVVQQAVLEKRPAGDLVLRRRQFGRRLAFNPRHHGPGALAGQAVLRLLNLLEDSHTEESNELGWDVERKDGGPTHQDPPDEDLRT